MARSDKYFSCVVVVIKHHRGVGTIGVLRIVVGNGAVVVAATFCPSFRRRSGRFCQTNTLPAFPRPLSPDASQGLRGGGAV